ncbi:MAG: hypothetical protein LBR66_06315 [Candidatus Symbiothrix sp.]|nr:hypothetical protein [Candidatus Symbiothrix sp.]
MSIAVIAVVVSTTGCGSMNGFVKSSANDKGSIFVFGANQNAATVANAVKYAFSKSKVNLKKEVNNGTTIILYGQTPAAMQSWGQNLKVTVEEKTVSNILVGSEAYYYYQPRIGINQTEVPISATLAIYATQYLEAAKEGIDLNEK